MHVEREKSSMKKPEQREGKGKSGGKKVGAGVSELAPRGKDGREYQKKTEEGKIEE